MHLWPQFRILSSGRLLEF